MEQIVFLKLGGGLITEKNQAHTPRPDVIQRLAGEIQNALQTNQDLKLLLGHGSGSFGHYAANKYKTQAGVSTPEQWRGFIDVWHEARALNQIVIEFLFATGLPVMAFPPSTGVLAKDGVIIHWDEGVLEVAMQKGIIPVINGDVAFDQKLGGTIVSTEKLFAHLARQVRPTKILIAGVEPGVWAHFPQRDSIIPEITSKNISSILDNLKGSSAIDVTGGMSHKVLSMLELVQSLPGLEVSIFSGEIEGNVQKALQNENLGTLIRAN